MPQFVVNLLPYFLVISRVNYELLVRENSDYYFAEKNSRIHFNNNNRSVREKYKRSKRR